MKNLLKKSISLLAAAMICTAQIPVGATHIMVQDAITKAFTLYQNGNYYEAIQVLENTNKNFATDSQLAEINDIIKYANDAISKIVDTQTLKALELYQSGDYYGAMNLANQTLNYDITANQKQGLEDIITLAKKGLYDLNTQKILSAYTFFNEGKYYEAIYALPSLNDELLDTQQRKDVQSIYYAANSALSAVSSQQITNLLNQAYNAYMADDYYLARQKLDLITKGLLEYADDYQKERYADLSEWVDNCIEWYEYESTHTYIYAKSGISMEVNNYELNSYLSTGVWFTSPKVTYEYMKSNAYNYIKNIIVDRCLKVPDGAEFPSVYNDQVTFYYECCNPSGYTETYTLKGWVKSKNYFGVKVKSYYTAQVTFNAYGICAYRVDWD